MRRVHQLDSNNHSVCSLHYGVPEMQSELWNGRFQSPTCLLLTTGDDPSELIKKYIETQEETQG